MSGTQIFSEAEVRHWSIIRFTSMSLLVAMVGSVQVAGLPTDATQERDNQAKAIAKEAEALAKGDKFVEARAKYIEALKLTDGSRVEQQYRDFEGRVSKKIKELLKAANPLFESGDYTQALTKLDEARALREGDPTVVYDVALVKKMMGEKVDAVALLGEAADSLTSDGDRGKLKQLKTEWETGESASILSAKDQADALDRLNEDIIAGDNPEETCKNLRALTGSVAHAPSVVFNLAKCAEDEGNLEEASKLLDQYLQAAPNALDAADSRARGKDLQALLDLQQRAGPDLLKLYADADRQMRLGRYKQAIQALEQAEAAAPEVVETQLRLARLLQGRGDVEGARRRYEKYLMQESDEAQRSIVEQEKNVLEDRAREYKAIMGPVSDRLRALMRQHIVEGHAMGQPAAQGEIKAVAEQLQRAALMVPLATDVNLMLGQVYLQAGNYGAARKSFSTVADSGSSIWFYATVDAPSEAWRKGVTSKIEIDNSGIRIIGLLKRDKKTKSLVPFTDTPNPDGLGGLFEAYDRQLCEATCLQWNASVISSLETVNDGIAVTRTVGKNSERLVIRPISVTTRLPPPGPASRRFENSYTKLFRDFADIKIKLGAEHMTGGEKFALVMEAVSAASNAWTLSSMMGGTYTATQRFAAALQSITWATITVQSTLEAQRRMFRELDFKVIAVDQPKPTFRTELFK